jgi:hypothetical protein
MKRFTWILATIVLLWYGLGSAKADHLYNTFGPGDSYDPINGFRVNGSANPAFGYVASAMEFSPSETATLDLVRFAVYATTAGPGSVDAVLVSDNGGQPGATLEDLGSVSVPGNNTPAIYSLSSSLHPLLTTGTSYWFILQPTDPSSALDVVWDHPDPPVLATAAYTLDPAHGSWNTLGNFIQAAVDIQGSPQTPVPEPASLGLLGLGALGLGIGAWRERRRLLRLV